MLLIWIEVLYVVVTMVAAHSSHLWQLCRVDIGGASGPPSVPCVSTTIPMSVHEALFSSGVIGDPLMEGFSHQWIAESDWEWTTDLLVDPSHTGDHAVKLSNVAGIADVYINNKLVGSTDNAFIEYEFPTSLVRGADTVRIRIVMHSLVNEAIRRQSRGREIPICPPESQEGFCGVQYVRVPPYLFGWDWGPGTGSMSIGDVDVRSIVRTQEMRYILVDTVMDPNNTWTVHVRVNISNREDTSVLHYSLMDDNGVSVISGESASVAFQFTVTQPSTWWPRGYGAQPMYSIRVCVASACITRRIGFRQIDVITEHDSWHFVINKEARMYIRGVNWIPTSAFRDSDNESVDLFNAMIRAEMNLVRVWGGGWYGTDHFYDSADRHGILVWEELKLAGATYPESILESLQLEIQQQLQRIYSHPSLVILSGDNEVSLMLEQNWYGVTREELHRLMTEYRKQQEFIAGVVGGFNAHAHFHFVPSSSTVGIDTHYYDYTTDCTDWASFPNKTVLVSEYGYQSWCNEGCLSQSMTDPDVELDTPWTESPFLRTRQHRQNGNKEIWNQSVKLFPDLLKREFVTVREFVWTSQLTQAVCLRAATETFRRQATNQGVMYWQLNDVWPAASWSTVGFDGLYKPSFYSARTAMAEDMVSMYVDKDDLVVGVRLTTSATTINSFNMYIVNMRDGNVATITVDQQSELTPNVFNILKRVPLTEVCADRTCVAAISPSNYILLGPIDRSLARFDQNQIASAVRVNAESAKSFRLSVTIPTPFIHLYCENTNFDWNSLFLFPPLWDSTVVQSDKDCASPKVYHFWSFFPTPANHQPYVVVAE